MSSRLGSFLFAIAGAFASTAAFAHAILIDSTPKPNGTVTAGHVRMVFKYNSKIDTRRSLLLLIGSDKRETLTITDSKSDESDELDTSADLSPGAYTVRWQALAVDGHITRGDLPFTVVAKP